MVQDEIRCLTGSIFKRHVETQGGREQEKSQQEQGRETRERALEKPERQMNQERDAKLPREGQASRHRHREAVSGMPARVEEGCRNGEQELATHGVIRMLLEGGKEVQDDVMQWATRENKNARAHDQKNEREQAMWREVEKALTKSWPAFGSPRTRREAAPGMEEGMLGEQARSNEKLGNGAQSSSRISGGKDQHARGRESIRMSGGKEQNDRRGSHGLSPSSTLALPPWLTSRRERHGTPGTPRTTTSSLTGSMLHLGDYSDSRKGKGREGRGAGDFNGSGGGKAQEWAGWKARGEDDGLLLRAAKMGMNRSFRGGADGDGLPSELAAEGGWKQDYTACVGDGPDGDGKGRQRVADEDDKDDDTVRILRATFNEVPCGLTGWFLQVDSDADGYA